MRIIPGKTKVGFELFKGVTVADLVIGGIAFILIILVLMASVPYKLAFLCGIIVIAGLLLVRVDDEPMYKTAVQVVLHCCSYHKNFSRSLVAAEGAVNEGEEAEKPLTKKEIKAKKAAMKKEKKEDDKLLRSHKLTPEQEEAIWLKRANQSSAKKALKAGKSGKSKSYPMREIMGVDSIENAMIHYTSGYYGMAMEIPPVEFRFFSQYRRNNAIENALGSVLRNINPDYAANIVKLDRPIYFDKYMEQEKEKVRQLYRSFENGMIKEDELKSRVEIIYDRLDDLKHLNSDNRVVNAGYFIVLFDKSIPQLRSHMNDAYRSLQNGAMNPHVLNDKELAVFLKYSNCMDFDEREIDHIAPEDYANWCKPRSVRVKNNAVIVNDVISYNFRFTKFPLTVGDAWLASVLSLPGTKVVIKCRPMDRTRSIKTIDHSLQELRGQYMATGVDSKRIELQNHIESLEGILATLQTENEQLLSTNVYITAYDIVNSRKDPTLHPSETAPYAQFENTKKTVRRVYRENGFRINSMQFSQTEGFVGSQINGYDPLLKEGRGIPSNSLAACFPWIYASICDDKGIKFGESEGVPVFIDFFRRDSERVNSNMVIVGKSGSGKSYATKSILTNLAAEDSKIFVLDPEDEYSELAKNLHGKFINVGNAQFGRLNPFQIITSLSDDEEGTDTVSGSYATHLQFLEEFFTQILPDCNKDALEYLNSLLDRLYTNMGITAETDLRSLRPEDYPIFDDLYDAILEEFQTANNDYIRNLLRTLMNYISKFSSDGRNANIWNGPSTITTEENFTVFNFQSMLANRNGTIANAQMLLVLKYIDNEIIKNREYNTKNNTKRKVIVVIDEAHVFIDSKYPVALDFMFQLAKRIRKYNGMQIVITQNIKDFVGSEEIARKSTAIINACQYSFIFALAPNDMDDLCKLYEKAGGINEMEQEKIITAPRGQAFTIMSAQSRSTFTLHVPDETVSMFEKPDYETHYFGDESGQAYWEEFIGDSREKYRAAYEERHPFKEDDLVAAELFHNKKRVTLVEMTEDEAEREAEERTAAMEAKAKKQKKTEEILVGVSQETVQETVQVQTYEPVTPIVQQAPVIQQTPIVQQAPIIQQVPVIQTVQADNSRVEELMEQMVDVVKSMKEFSYDAIMGRVQEMMQQRFVPVAAAAAPAQEVQSSPVISEPQEQNPGLDLDMNMNFAANSDVGTVDGLNLSFDTGSADDLVQNDNADSDSNEKSLGDMLHFDVGTEADSAGTTGEGEFNITNFDFMAQLNNSLAEYVNDVDCFTDMKINGEMKRVINLNDLNNLLKAGISGKRAV